MSGVFASAANEAVSTSNLVRSGARIARPAYRQSLLAVSGTPDILMVSSSSASRGSRSRRVSVTRPRPMWSRLAMLGMGQCVCLRVKI